MMEEEAEEGRRCLPELLQLQLMKLKLLLWAGQWLAKKLQLQTARLTLLI